MSYIETFNKNYPYFIKRLTKESSDLTQREILLCMYLKLNYSNREICKLMNISEKTVDSYRHRARKKMGLKRSDSFVSFLNRL